jgi:membrane-associated protease RseP (regulator of RpoE activity)
VKDPLAVETRIEPRRAIWAVIAVIVTAVLLITVKPSVLFTIAVIMAFFLMIMLHELGHFVTAKRTGMKVTEFFVGFGPRIWSFTRGETEYGVKALPLGGYCRIIGMTNLEDVPPEDEPRTYRQKPYGARVLVAGAGSMVHFTIALLLMLAVLLFGNVTKLSTTIGAVESGQPASAAGLMAGDRIQSIDGTAVHRWEDVSKIVVPRAGQTVPFVVERDGVFWTYAVTLGTHAPDSTTTRGFAGIESHLVHEHLSPISAVVQTPQRVWDMATQSVGALGSMFSPHGVSNYAKTLQGSKTANPNDRPVSVIGIGRVANQAVNAGWVDVFGLLIAINVFIGLFNLIPLLPFDGGHIAIATYEEIASKLRHRRVRADVAKLMPLTVAVLGVLGFLMLSSIYLDISQPLKNPF